MQQVLVDNYIVSVRDIHAHYRLMTTHYWAVKGDCNWLLNVTCYMLGEF